MYKDSEYVFREIVANNLTPKKHKSHGTLASTCSQENKLRVSNLETSQMQQYYDLAQFAALDIELRDDFAIKNPKISKKQ